MALGNKLGTEGSTELVRVEKKISKKKALGLFETGLLDQFEAGTFGSLANIHRYLSDEVYNAVGEVREASLAKGGFRLAPAMYLSVALQHINRMSQSTFSEITEEYVEMNVAHPFREGNGRSTRIWLDSISKKELGKVVDWNQVDKEDYLLAMEHSPIRDIEIKLLLNHALTDKVNDRDVYMKGIDASYRYEGYYIHKTESMKSE